MWKNTLPLVISAFAVVGLEPSSPGSSRAIGAEPIAPVVAAADPITVAIAAPTHHGSRWLSLDQPFRVVITNTSDQPVRIWREWCSWGYFQLTLVLEREDGTKHRVAKRPRPWFKNYPDFWTLAPHEPLIWNVHLDTAKWKLMKGFDDFKKANKGKTFKLRAIFQAAEDRESKKLKVWTGTVLSPNWTYRLPQ